MSCLSNPKIKNALTKLISNDLHTRSVDGVKVDLEAYVREVYDFIKKSSNNDMTALTGARMVPTLINLITVHDPELAAEIKKVSPTLRSDAMMLSLSFEESIDNTINFLNRNLPAIPEGETAEYYLTEINNSLRLVSLNATLLHDSSYLRRHIFHVILYTAKEKDLCKNFDLKIYTKDIYYIVKNRTKNDNYGLRAAQNVPNLINQLITYHPEGDSILSALGIDKNMLAKLAKSLLDDKNKIIHYLNLISTEDSTIKEQYKNSDSNTNINFLFFDTETNGKPKNFKAPVTDVNNWPRITQFGWQLYDSEQNLINEGSYLVKPDGWEIPKEKFFLDNNMSTERCEKFGKPIDEVLEIFISDISKTDYLIAHNMNFDINVLGAELIRANKQIPKDVTKICTMSESTNYCKLPGPYGYKWPTLAELHNKLFSTGFDGAHDALDDVKACAKSFFELKKLNVINLNKHK
jgi:DNA polymerase-3 subunit epsilon